MQLDQVSTRAARSPTVRFAGRMTLAVGVFLLACQLIALAVHPAELARIAGLDFSIYLDHTRRALEGGSFYLDRQLHGPYSIELGDSYYPPPTILLFAPFLVLPAIAWWIVPIAVVVAVVAYWRPGPWGLAAIVWSMWWWRSTQIVILGNPSMWIAAAVAAGTLARWPLALIVLKPTLLPFVALGVGGRGFWISLGVLALLSLPFALMWTDYARAAMDSSIRWSYSLNDIPLVLIGVTAWLGSRWRPPIRSLSWLRAPSPSSVAATR
jgi:hypothetical protein